MSAFLRSLENSSHSQIYHSPFSINNFSGWIIIVYMQMLSIDRHRTLFNKVPFW